MVKDSLREGQVRLGLLFDGNPDTPEVAVMLQNTDEQIVLTVPIKVWDYVDPYTRWFRHGATSETIQIEPNFRIDLLAF